MSNSSRRDSVGRLVPATQTSPLLGLSCAAIKRNSVVLPQPDGPMMAVTLPRGMTMSMLLKMLRSPRMKVTPFSSTALALAALIGSPWIQPANQTRSEQAEILRRAVWRREL